MRRFLLLSIFILALGTTARGQMMALKTNALMDLACAPNLTLELATSGKTSVGLQVFGSKNCWGNRIQTIGASPEFRYWITGRTFDRFFVGLGAQAVHYGITWKGENRDGDAAGAGLTLGYDLYLGSHWTMEFHSGIGAMYYRQQHTWEGDELKYKRYTEKGYSVIPMQLGVSITYIIK